MAGSRTSGNLNASVLDASKSAGEAPEKEVQSMFNFQRKAALLAVPAVLALGVVSYGSVVAFSAPVTKAAAVTAAAPAEPAESSTDATEANEPALPGGGYADADNVQADTQQEGVN
jgi:hypothetical protein